MHLLALWALAARVGRTPPVAERASVQTSLETLAGAKVGHLTEGQWLGLVRELLRPYETHATLHPLPALVGVFFGRDRVQDTQFQVLQGLRNRLAHREQIPAPDDEFPVGTELPASLDALGLRALAALEALLFALAPLWTSMRLVAPWPTRARHLGASLVGNTAPRCPFPVVLTEALEGLSLVPRDGGKPLPLEPFVTVLPTQAGGFEVLLLSQRERQNAVYLSLGPARRTRWLVHGHRS